MNTTELMSNVETLTGNGYMVLAMEDKFPPPTGTTGNFPWENEVFAMDNGGDLNFLAVRYSEGTCGLDVDTDTQAGHSTGDAEELVVLWKEFLDAFNFAPVVTGANRANLAGIYHFRLDEGMTEHDVAGLRIKNLDVLRLSHRYAVVRGTHPKTGKEYTGELPHIDELPVLTWEMLNWLKARPEASVAEVRERTVSADMPKPVYVTSAERNLMHDKRLDAIDWSKTGGRNVALFAATQHAFYRVLADDREVAMGKALAYIEPWLEKAYEHADETKALTRYADLDTFWRANHNGLSEALLGKEGTASVEETVTTETVSEPVDGLDLMNRVVNHFDTYIVADEAPITLLALWTMHTHLVDETYTSPRLFITSAMPGSGKTTVLDHMRRLCFWPLGLASVSSDALLARVVEQAPRTLLIDEADRTLRKESEKSTDIIAILNSGYRKGSTRPVLVSQDKEWIAKEMPTFAPVVLAGNNPQLPEDTMQRCIKVLLMPDHLGIAADSDWQMIEDDVKALGQEIAKWADQVREQVRANKPTLPDGIRGRMREKWEPLKRIAEAVGGHYPSLVDEMAEHDLRELKRDMAEGFTSRPVHIRLLMDVETVWFEDEVFVPIKVLNQRLVQGLPDDWGVESGRSLTAQWMGKLLSDRLGIRTERVRIDGEQVRGYYKKSFEKAWKQFAPPEFEDDDE